MNLQPEKFSFVGKEEKPSLGIRNKDMLNKVFFAGLHALEAFSTSLLNAVFVERNSLNVPRMGHHDHLVFAGNLS